MVHYTKKHRVAEISEQYGDYAALILGVLGFSALVGAIGAVTLLPDYGTSGLFALDGTFYSVNSTTTITYGAALASLAAVVMYGTNQTLDQILNVQDAWKETEFVAFAGGAILPIAHSLFTSVSNLFVGSVGMQVIGVGLYAYCLFYLSDL